MGEPRYIKFIRRCLARKIIAMYLPGKINNRRWPVSETIKQPRRALQPSGAGGRPFEGMETINVDAISDRCLDCGDHAGSAGCLRRERADQDQRRSEGRGEAGIRPSGIWGSAS